MPAPVLCVPSAIGIDGDESLPQFWKPRRGPCLVIYFSAYLVGLLGLEASGHTQGRVHRIQSHDPDSRHLHPGANDELAGSSVRHDEQHGRRGTSWWDDVIMRSCAAACTHCTTSHPAGRLARGAL